ncbi:MAG: succinate--CoA ligase subunit alpha [Elusimicrobiota bacterium]
MAILANKNSKIVVQGITGKTGSFHADLSLKLGTNIVAGVSPGKGGQRHLGVPVFDTLEAAKAATGPLDATVIFVPAPLALEAIAEALDAKIPLIIVITEGIPVRDMVSAKKLLAGHESRMIGPNCPGLLVPGECRLGIIPGKITPPGSIGIVSRSGTLTYEAARQIAQAGLGVSTVVGIGGDPVIGTDFCQILDLFHQDPATQAVLMIGEIGGSMEQDAAAHWSGELGRAKPLFGLIAGKTAPKGKRMGHAGAIMEAESDSAASKAQVLKNRGVVTIDELTQIGQTVLERLGKTPAAVG